MEVPSVRSTGPYLVFVTVVRSQVEVGVDLHLPGRSRERPPGQGVADEFDGSKVELGAGWYRIVFSWGLLAFLAKCRNRGPQRQYSRCRRD